MAVVAFDPLGGGWLTAAHPAPPGAVADLDGELVRDPAALAAAADDYGHPRPPCPAGREGGGGIRGGS